MDLVFANRQYAGELWRDELVAMCKENPTLNGSNGPVDVSAACPVLEKWDLKDDLDSRGALLFRRFATRALAKVGGVANPPVSPFRNPFSASDPVNTPNGLNTDNGDVRKALADAVTDLQGASIPLDAPLRDFQYEKRGDEKIPIHGGPGTVGDLQRDQRHVGPEGRATRPSRTARASCRSCTSTDAVPRHEHDPHLLAVDRPDVAATSATRRSSSRARSG